jgi:hypothetical protein
MRRPAEDHFLLLELTDQITSNATKKATSMSPSTKLPPGPSKRTLTTDTGTATATATLLLNNKEKSSSGLRELCNKGVAWRKQTENAVVLQAAKDLLQTRAKTGGNATYGDVKHILLTYQDLGHMFVTRGRLSYQVEKLTSGKKKKNTNTTMPSTTFPSSIHVRENDESSVQSELTDSFGSKFKFNESLSLAAEAERSSDMNQQQTPTAVGVHVQQQLRNKATGRPIATISTEQSNSHQQTNSSTEQRSDDINRVIRDVAFFLSNER